MHICLCHIYKKQRNIIFSVLVDKKHDWLLKPQLKFTKYWALVIFNLHQNPGLIFSVLDFNFLCSSTQKWICVKQTVRWLCNGIDELISLMPIKLKWLYYLLYSYKEVEDRSHRHFTQLYIHFGLSSGGYHCHLSEGLNLVAFQYGVYMFSHVLRFSLMVQRHTD